MNAPSLAELTKDLNIHKFSDWKVFAERLETAIRCGRAKSISKLWQVYRRGELWFVDTFNGEIFVYLEPDDKILPEWSRVDVFTPPPERMPNPKNINEVGLRAIPTGMMGQVEGRSLEQMLGILVSSRLIEVVGARAPELRALEQVWVSTYRDRF